MRNTNAQTSGAYADWEKAYEKLDDEQQAYVDRIAAESIEESREYATDLDEGRRERLAREYGTLFILSSRALADEVERGFIVEETVELPDGGSRRVNKANPSSMRLHRISSRQRAIGKKLRILPAYQD